MILSKADLDFIFNKIEEIKMSFNHTLIRLIFITIPLLFEKKKNMKIAFFGDRKICISL